MIQAYFDDLGNPKVKIAVGGSRMQVEVEALIDTGFNGYIILPSLIATRLGLELTSVTWVELADGSVIRNSVFSGHTTFGGQSQEVEIMMTDSDEALIGTALLSNYKLTIDFVNRTVEITESQPE
jgi:clan AA aspartic protease